MHYKHFLFAPTHSRAHNSDRTPSGKWFKYKQVKLLDLHNSLGFTGYNLAGFLFGFFCIDDVFGFLAIRREIMRKWNWSRKRDTGRRPASNCIIVTLTWLISFWNVMKYPSCPVVEEASLKKNAISQDVGLTNQLIHILLFDLFVNPVTTK